MRLHTFEPLKKLSGESFYMENTKPVEKHNNKKLTRRILIILAVVAVIALLIVLLAGGSTENFRSKYAGEKNLDTDVSGYSRSNTYRGYLEEHEYYEVHTVGEDDGLPKPVDVTLYMDAAFVTDAETGETEIGAESKEELRAQVIEEGGEEYLLTKEGGMTLWEMSLKDEGYYLIRVDYKLADPENGDALRSLYVNDEKLFEQPAFEGEEQSLSEKGILTFPAGENADEWQSLYLADPNKEDEEHFFALDSGITSLMLKAEAGDVIVKDIVLLKRTVDVTYEAYDYGKAYNRDYDPAYDPTSPAYDKTNEVSPTKSSPTVAVEAENIEVDVTAFEGDGESVTEDGIASVFQPDGGLTTWKVTVPKSGFYNVLINYKTTQSRGVDIERELLINGELPFSGADSLTFSRLWTDDPASKKPDGSYRTDNQGNEIRPSQKEIFDWQSAYCKDDMGYTVEPYRFWFNEGENTLSLKASNEPMIIGGISLTPILAHTDYAAYAKANENKTDNAAAGTLITVQGEDAYLRSSPSLYPRYDRSSPATLPSSLDKTVMNYIGGDSWSSSGQWIEWEFTVPEDGYYNITLKARQQYQRGSVSCRSVYIDGEIPFEELSSVSFMYDTSWQMRTLGDANGNAYSFYLTKGTHTIRLEATLGEMGRILERVEDSIFRLNEIYRSILVLTGVNPDRFRDYNLTAKVPGAIEAMDLESKRLYKLVDDTVDITGQKSDRIAVAQTLAVQLEQFVDRNERITQAFANFKDNITSLGTSLQNMSQIKLDIDQIIISKPGTKLPAVHDGGVYKLWHEIKSCVASYFIDYNSLGDKYEEGSDHVIQVWIVTGRDQSTVLKTMVDDMFTPESGIKVNVKLVAADAILTAVVAGNGPDVVLSVDSWFAANYAMRNAVEDLTQFDDFEEATSAFLDSAIVPISYNNGTKTGVYGLPETQVYSLLFYREDILEELELEVPQTWDELVAMLPTIQGKNMTIGIPYPDIANPDISVFNTLIYQNGGAIYDEDAKHTLIDSEAGVRAFKLYTSFYNNHGLPTVFDFVSRFRSGEMPLGIAPYTTYNTLAVSAPEIRNLWDFTLIPGTLNENGEIDRSVHSNGVCCLMIATDDETVKKDSWEFMKWWVSADAQVRFGREMESILGASARYATANTEALRQLAWSSDQLAILEEQQASAVGFREIAGGYSTTRHMTNAVRRVINTKEDPRETLLTYSRTINEEIKIKRQEFNLPID